MYQSSLNLMLTLLAMLFLAACGGRDRDKPTSDEMRGEALFQTHCDTCHAVAGDRTIVGPSLEGIANRAASRIESYDATAYLTESILNPDAYIVEGFVQGSMQQNFAERLASEDVDYLVAYLLTLK